GSAINNAVAMGQGEPFLNIESVKKALEILTHPKCFGMSRRHLTVSTAGIVPGIRTCADESFPCRLAVSLHSAKNQVRDVLVPINRKYPLEELKIALRYYADLTKNRITFEYILIDNVNDSTDDARELCNFINGLPSFVNLIPYNAVGQTGYRRPSGKRIANFADVLARAGIEACIRQEKGADIHAACGQLTQQIFNG
ncbi:MAG: radical SAM protein, partial [Spirochaetaceae bacterium]